MCHYGTLPGGWIRSKGRALLPWQDEEEILNRTFSVWQPYCAACQLQPLLTPYLEVHRAPLTTSGAELQNLCCQELDLRLSLSLQSVTHFNPSKAS